MYKKLYGNTGAHSNMSDRQVLRLVYRMMRPEVRRDPSRRERRHEVYRGVLDEHRRWQRVMHSIAER